MERTPTRRSRTRAAEDRAADDEVEPAEAHEDDADGAETFVTPTREELLADFGGDRLSMPSLFRFSYVPSGRANHLADLLPEEDWGENHYVLLKYLSVHVRLAIEQGAYVWNDDQCLMTAGSLRTKEDAPVYLGFVPNQSPDEQPWVLNWVGERPAASELPDPAKLPDWPELHAGAEVLVAADVLDEERGPRLGPVSGLPAAARASAVAGAVQWALHRGLLAKQLHGGARGWFVPLYLTSREDLAVAPDRVAPIWTSGSRIVVRAAIDPHVAYPAARAVVERWEQLPVWLVDAWERSAEGDGDGADR